MSQLNTIAINQQGSTGRTHTRQLRIICRQLINNQVRALNLISQVNAAGTILKIRVIKRSQVQNRRSRRDIAAHVAAHAVSNDRKETTTVAGVIILRAFQTRIRAGLKTKSNLHTLAPQLHGGTANAEIITGLNRGRTSQTLAIDERTISRIQILQEPTGTLRE